MLKLQKFGGAAAIGEGLIYISMFIYWGALLNYPSDASFLEQLQFVDDNRVSLSIMNFVGYILFGIFLAVLVQALHERLRKTSPYLTQSASIFGLVWVVIIIAGGMLANISLQSVLEITAEEPEQARSVWLSVKIVEEALGGGIEIVGGLWTLLISLSALKANHFSKALNYLGVIIGVFGILTLYPLDLFKLLFGVLQIVWFIWLGIAMLKTTESSIK